MVVVRGINVFPTAVAAVINECPEFSGEYRIVLEGPGPYERLPLEAELASGHEATSDLEKSLAQSIKTRLSVTPKVTLMPPDSLPRTAGKNPAGYPPRETVNSAILSSIDDGVCTVTLNRPECLNALNRALLPELKAILSNANADPAVRVILMRGAGRAFCSGQDLKEFDHQSEGEAEARAYIESIQDMAHEMVLGEKMIVGAIQGWAVGGGLEWLINCDLAILAAGTRCFFPEISLGVFVTGGITNASAEAGRITKSQRTDSFW